MKASKGKASRIEVIRVGYKKKKKIIKKNGDLKHFLIALPVLTAVNCNYERLKKEKMSLGWIHHFFYNKKFEKNYLHHFFYNKKFEKNYLHHFLKDSDKKRTCGLFLVIL